MLTYCHSEGDSLFSSAPRSSRLPHASVKKLFHAALAVGGKPLISLTCLILADDNTRAPNEKLHRPTFHRGLETQIHYDSLLTGSDPISALT